ncbi:hypothetical protein PVL29_009222 [Vitis rotundifolia]|uniref:Uncharacterized protein n=1 Tax=Vitis rotundifolia TaxID=103349 RepID=A0AA38ZY33_VITRO|nr:hypothetical protein PVL29_009222 [Vitis rotundifolia]
MATLTGTGASAVSTTNRNTRDTGGGVASSPGLGGGLMTSATANGVGLAATFRDVGVGGGLAGLRTPKASSAAVAGRVEGRACALAGHHSPVVMGSQLEVRKTVVRMMKVNFPSEQWR